MAENTLGSLKAGDLNLTLYCHARKANGEFCYHGTTVNLDRMIERHGPDMTLDQFKARSRCKKCGHRPCDSVTVAPNRTGGAR